ncbi:MAG: ComEA family DNA-binding protein [Candidatus Bathyarchaeia archaeon]|jgi:hypothetical protein
MSRIVKPEETSENTSKKVLRFLNAATTSEEIANAIEVPGERDVDLKIAQRILDTKTKSGPFTTLTEVADIPLIGPKRFSAIVDQIGTMQEGVEKQRTQFKTLIAANPNYFGNMTSKLVAEKFKPIVPMATNTKYEEIVCVGLYPEDNVLEAVIKVKLPNGYLGPLCAQGSKEYVSFYIDYNDGAGFELAGATAEVNVHDLSSVDGEHIYYAVRTSFTPKKQHFCNSPQIVKVRAILSWQTIPTGPNYPPAWGNVVECWVQIKPYKTLILALPEFTKTENMVFVGDKLEVKAMIEKSIAAEEMMKKEGKIEAERANFKELITKNPNYFGSISKSQEKSPLMKAVKSMPSSTVKDLLPKLVVNPDLLIPVVLVDPKVKYEELKCVGLYPEGDLLEAIIELKLPSGFNGDLCTLGSQEYVAFYIDWGTGYQYVNTASVAVHDIPKAADKHLFYAVKATIPKEIIESKLEECTTENVVKVKAILSWNADPTPYGHTYTPAWGNVLEKQIQIRPLNGASAECKLEIVSGIHVDDIAQVGTQKGLAIKIYAGDTVPGTYDRPFGGLVAVWANINLYQVEYYRFRYSEDNGLTWKNVMDKRTARSIFGYSIKRGPDADGWFSRAEYEDDLDNYSLTSLAQWNTAGKNGNYLLKLELANGAHTLLKSSEVHLVIDNVQPKLFTFGGTPTPLPAKGVVIKDTAGNYRKCGTFTGPEPIVIYGNFSDDYFRNYSLTVFGGNINVSGVGIGSGTYDPPTSTTNETGVIGAADGGMGQELMQLNLCGVTQSPAKVKCAYGVKLGIWTRTIVGYMSGYQFDTTSQHQEAFVTFDWDPSGCPT